jgi:hypothetical protein
VAGDFEERLYPVKYTVRCCDRRVCIPWASPEKEDGSGFLVMVHRPAHFSRVFFLYKTNVPNLSYQNDGLCDRSTASCAADGHLQTHVCCCCEVVPRWVDVGCGVRGLVGTVQIEACSVCFAVSRVRQVTTLPTHTLVKTVARRMVGKERGVDSATCLLAAHLPAAAVKQQGSNLGPATATDEHETNTSLSARPSRLYTSLQPWATNGESKITCLVSQVN